MLVASRSRVADDAGSTIKELRKHLAMNVEALNHAVAGIPPERMRIHVCWGNYEGTHHRDVELKEIAEGARIASRILRHAPRQPVVAHA